MVRLKNSLIFSHGFNESFRNLCKLQKLQSNVKLQLVKFRRELIAQAEHMQTLQKAGADSDEMRDIMNEENDYMSMNPIDIKIVVNQLSADDLYNLEPLLVNKGE